MCATTSTPGPNADPRFVDYYAEQSESAITRQRFEGTRRVTLQARRGSLLSTTGLDVVDIGCGAGTQSLMWAADLHRVLGVDISAPLIDLARQRADAGGSSASFRVGSATALPIEDASVDIALVSELLEHLDDWESCVNEAIRILRPGGVLYLATTNRLCPKQQEFELLGYSWYPASLKKRCERMSVTTHGHWVRYTSFPAVHWFSFYQLRDYPGRARRQGAGPLRHDGRDGLEPSGAGARGDQGVESPAVCRARDDAEHDAGGSAPVLIGGARTARRLKPQKLACGAMHDA